MPDNRKELLRKLCEELIAFKKSPLYKERLKNKAYPVFGEGNHYAEIMFVGEAPGVNEAKTGKPFCGAAGRVLDELLKSINLERETVYVTNIVKDRPTNNRDPLPLEIELYAPFLNKQIEIIQPRLVATLGRYSMGYMMKKFNLDSYLATISRIHGTLFKASASYGEIKIMPLYHPAMALYNPLQKKEMLNDFQKLKKLLS